MNLIFLKNKQTNKKKPSIFSMLVCVCVLRFLLYYILFQKLIIFSLKTIFLVKSISYFFPYKKDRAIFLYSIDYLRTSSLCVHRLPLTHLLSKPNNFSSFLHHSFFMLSISFCAHSHITLFPSFFFFFFPDRMIR